jgi:hypothetical protein
MTRAIPESLRAWVQITAAGREAIGGIGWTAVTFASRTPREKADQLRTFHRAQGSEEHPDSSAAPLADCDAYAAPPRSAPSSSRSSA